MAVESAELDELIRASNIRITVDEDTSQVRSFKTFEEAKEFFEHECEFWSITLREMPGNGSS